MSRLDDVGEFYECLSVLEARCAGKRTLDHCDAGMGWPKLGVYFFFEPDEIRTHSGRGLRVVRVGTHGLVRRSKSTLWNRLAQHRSGNQNGSIFRKLVGDAIISRKAAVGPALSGGDLSPADLKSAVSRHIGAMPFLWLAVEDDPSPGSVRSYVEKNSIALLSNIAARSPSVIDPPSARWLGLHCPKNEVCRSGLWNSRHVEEEYDRYLLACLRPLCSKG